MSGDIPLAAMERASERVGNRSDFITRRLGIAQGLFGTFSAILCPWRTLWEMLLSNLYFTQRLEAQECPVQGQAAQAATQSQNQNTPPRSLTGLVFRCNPRPHGSLFCLVQYLQRLAWAHYRTALDTGRIKGPQVLTFCSSPVR